MKEDVEKVIEKIKLGYTMGGGSIELVDVSDDGIVKVKLTSAMSGMFKVAGKKMSAEDIMKEEVEKQIKASVKGVKKVTFVD
jgi:Fe-S cluster biogenesis protein NfuA